MPLTSSSELLNSLDKVLTQLREHQRETLRMQEQFQQNQAEYFRIFFELTQQQATLNLSPQLMEGIAQSMMRFHDHQAETLKLHERFMGAQASATQGLLDVLRQQYAVLANVPFAPAVKAITPEPIIPIIPAITPAPVTPVPAPFIPPTAVAAVVPTAMSAPTPVAAIPAPVAPAPTVYVPTPVVAPISVPTAKAGGVDVSALSKAMLRIVADKTGYPSDMLELSMDMEADLGIDSIKRVEILGAMRDEFPNLPQFSPEELGELRTLAQIVDYMQASVSKNGGTVAVATPAPAPVAVVASTPVVTPTPIAPVPSVAVAPVPTASVSGGVDVMALSNAMLRIVADKTGYPSDMLELSMDMEADLGIDSIKRVEILGAMRDEFPALPQFSPEELGELRTLGQIVDYMRASVNGSNGHPPTPPSSPSPSSTPTVPVVAAVAVTPVPAKTNGSSNGHGLDLAALATAMLRIVGDKTGYPVDMLELGMDMEADLGIDSIKRVEILGAMRDEFPVLPQFSPEELGELRTLGQIVDYMQASANGAASEGSNGVGTQNHASLHRETLTTSPTNGTPEIIVTPVPGSHIPRLNPLDYGIERSIVELRRLPLPDSMEYAVAPGSVCLITDDGTPATGELAAQMSGQGWQAVVLSFPTTIIPAQSQLPAGIQRVTLPNMSESALQTALKQIPNIGTFIHLSPNANLHNGTLFLESEKAIIKHVFLMAKHLKAALHSNASGRKAFITVTRLDGTFGTANQTAFGTIAGGVFGLVKTLSLEWDGVFCRALDLTPTMSAAQTASTITAELHDPNRLITEVAYGTQGRVTLTARQAAATIGAN